MTARCQQQTIAAMLERLPGAALAVRANGDIVGANDLSLQLLHLTSTSDPIWWKAVRDQAQPSLSAVWNNGVSAGVLFELEISGSLAAFASPVLALDSEIGWLITLETSEEGVPTSRRLSAENFTAPALKTALKAAHLGLWEWDPVTDKAHWSADLYDLLRLPRGTGTEPGMRFMDMVFDEDRHLVESLKSALETAGSYAPVKLRVLAGDGTTRWLVSCGQLARSGARSIVVGVNLDITDSVEAEGRLSQARAESEQQRKIVASVLEHVPVGIAVSIVGDEQLSLVSKYGLDMIECGEHDGKRWDAWTVYHADGVTPARREEMALHRAAKGEVIRNEEWFIRRTDGHLLPVSCDAGPILNVDGGIAGGVVAWYDVTPFKEAEQERRRSLEAEQISRRVAEETNKQKDVFIGVVSHELRTPLSAILGWTTVIERAPTSANIDRGLAAISRNAGALARLVDDLLDVTRMSVGKLEVTVQSVGLHDVLSSAVDSVKGLADAAKVTIEWDRRAADVQLQADPLRLQQAVWNLLSNAVKFSPPGGLVLLNTALHPHEISLEVTDHGQGLSSDQVRRVFDQFWQAGSGEARSGGLGLGLALTKYIAEEHHGRVEASSGGLGQGATFKIILPL